MDSLKKIRTYPLTDVQKGLLFHTIYNKQTATYISQSIISLKEAIQVTPFLESVKTVVARHEVLYSSFEYVADDKSDFIQKINYPLMPEVVFIDYSNLTSLQSEQNFQQLIDELRHRPFELSVPPLYRFHLIKISNLNYRFICTYHHILLCAPSAFTIIKEIFEYYDCYLSNKLCDLPKIPSYQNFLDNFEKLNKPEALEYWKQVISGFDNPSTLPKVGSVSSTEKNIHAFEIPSALLTAIKNFNHQHGLTLNILLQAAWGLLLSFYSDSKDVVFGSVRSYPRPLVKDFTGLFINTLPIRLHIEPNTRVIDYINQLKQQHQGLGKYFFTPLSEIQKYSNIAKSEQLFETAIDFKPQTLNAQLKDLGPQWENRELRFTTDTNYHFLVEAYGEQNTLHVLFNYDLELFEPHMISRMANQFQHLLTQLIYKIDEPLSKISIMDESERLQVIDEWNETKVSYPKNSCVHQVIELQAKKTPDVKAISFEDKSLTYQELNNRANQLAHHLKKEGIGSDVLVGLCLERSLEMVIAILGILKAGGAYVPFDPTYPQERIDFMLEDTQAPIMLVQQKFSSLFSKKTAKLICLDTNWDDIKKNSTKDLKNSVQSNNLAYVIYTSGSTGKPKGVMVEHQAILNRLFWMQDTYKLDDKDIVLQKTPYSFDVSVWEFLWPLMFGAHLVVARPNGHQDTRYLAKLISKQKITTLHFVPTMLQAFLNEDLSGCKSLKNVFCSGEALSWSLQQRFFKSLKANLHNLYGPTEAAIDVTYWQCHPKAREKVVPIGHPIANTQIYILNAYLQAAPIGVAGELHIGGIGLARGYLNKPELTKDKFIANPFSKDAGSRLYKTGDLARYLPDGTIEYLGRIDTQVKVRGFRVELSEIENTLARCDGIKENVVILREDTPGEKRLVAYIVPEQANSELPISTLRQSLKLFLPEYMIPAVFVQIETMPATINGKLDRSQLPIPGSDRPLLAVSFVAPSTREEKALAQIWCDILNLEKVGIHDNFFELGGDSIKSIEVLARAEKNNIRFSLQQLFKYPTIHGISTNLSQETGNNLIGRKVTPFSLIKTNDFSKIPKNIEDAYPLSALQAGMIFHTEFDVGSHFYQVVFSMHIKADFNLSLWEKAVQILSKHPILRTSFDLTNFSEPLQLVHTHSTIPSKIEDIRHLSKEEQERIILEFVDTKQKYDFEWSEFPLLQLHVYQRHDDSFQLGVCFHVAIFDGWSAASMIAQLLENYFALLQQKKPNRSPISATYKDYISLEQDAINNKMYRTYWHQKLNGNSFTKLPRLHKNIITAESKDLSFIVQPQILKKLQSLAQTLGIPIKSLLLTAYMSVLSLFTAEKKVITGLVSNGRPEVIDGEKILGNFLNTLPFCINLMEGSWKALIEQIFNAELEQIPYRRYPGAYLQRELGGQPLFETAFNFTHFHVYKNLVESKNFTFIDGIFTDPFHYPLTANCRLNPLASHLELVLNYNNQELTEEQVIQFGEYYLRALNHMALYPDDLYRDAYAFSIEENNQAFQRLASWNDTQISYAQDRYVHQLIELQAKRTPDAIAISFEESSLTYQELNRRSNQLAHHLKNKGLGPDVLVGLCLERSLEMVIAILGILKAGGAYVPIDPSYPKERIDFMLEDTQAPIMLVQQKFSSLFSNAATALICLDSDWDSIKQNSSEAPKNCIQANNLAYVIYTSGSTGKPKGVMVEHQAILNRLLWMQDAYKLCNKDVVLQKTPYSFDVSVWEFLWPLMFGAHLVLARPNGHQDTRYLAELISKKKITTLHFVPTMLQAFLNEDIGDCTTLKNVFCSGEALSWSLQQRFFKILKADLHNLYGPTEAAIDVTYWQCRPEFEEKVVPIGRPIANTQIYILNAYLQPVPVGVAGELHIGGIGLARGYLNKSELTKEKFIPNPFSTEASSRLYKTGDLARYLPNGTIEYLGRIDTQVKVRGFRVELSEIENALARCDGVKENVVVLREDSPGEKRLVAYIVPKQAESELPVSALRQSLKLFLPEYMIPSVFVDIESIPVTVNGKLDRSKLPIPGSDRPQLEVSFVAPTTQEEKALAQIWCDILGLEKVGIHDNFFELGGDSIQSLQISHRANNIGLRFTPKNLFDAPTITKLIKVANRTEVVNAEQEIVKGNVPLLPIQHGFFEQDLVDAHHWNAMMFLDMPKKVDLRILTEALKILMSHHDALRLRFKQHNGMWVQTNSDEIDERLLHELTLSNGSFQDQANLAREAILSLHASLSFSKGSLFKAALINLNAENNKILLIAHHLLIDGISWRVISEDLLKIYEQLSMQVPVELPLKTTSFKKWSEELTKFAQSQDLHKELPYWLEITRKPSHMFSKLSKHQDIEKFSESISCSIDKEHTKLMVRKVPSVFRANINEILLTALAWGIRDLSDSPHLSIDMHGHGREQLFDNVDISRTVGWFTSVFPVLISLDKTADLFELLQLNKTHFRSVPGNGIGYGLLRYLSKNESCQELKQARHSQVSFNYLGQFENIESSSVPFHYIQKFRDLNKSSRAKRNYVLEFEAIIVNDQLHLTCIFNSQSFNRNNIANLLNKTKESIEQFVNTDDSSSAIRYTASDFPLVAMSTNELNDLIDQLNDSE